MCSLHVPSALSRARLVRERGPVVGHDEVQSVGEIHRLSKVGAM